MHTIREITRLTTMLTGLITPRLCLGFVSALSRLRSPASIGARHAITLIVRQARNILFYDYIGNYPGGNLQLAW